MNKTPARRLEINRKWRLANIEYDRARCRKRYSDQRERELARKREYYQGTRKLQDQTELGRFKDRERKSRRRAAYADGALTIEQWQEICALHNYCCAYCGCPSDALEMDHVIAISRGGRHIAGNIAPACKPCNSAKGSK
jgi:5-methylcytosine-specific restriction endonuclease McrA